LSPSTGLQGKGMSASIEDMTTLEVFGAVFVAVLITWSIAGVGALIAWLIFK